MVKYAAPKVHHLTFHGIQKQFLSMYDSRCGVIQQGVSQILASLWWFGFRLEQIFFIAPAAQKHDA